MIAEKKHSIERGRINRLLIARPGFYKENVLKASDKHVLWWMGAVYGPHHHDKWRVK